MTEVIACTDFRYAQNVYAATIERLFGNGGGKEWEQPSGNPMGMGIGYKIGNGNGKEWELIMWEWEEWECKTPFPIISSVDICHDV